MHAFDFVGVVLIILHCTLGYIAVATGVVSPCACCFDRHMFDFIIVTLALVALGPIDIPVKALRVFRM